MLDTNRQRAGLVLLVFGAALLIALAPFATGLLTIPVLYIVLHPLHLRIARRTGSRVSAGIVVVIALLLVVIPGAGFVVLLINQAQSIASGLSDNQALQKLSTLHLGRLDIGPYLAGLGARAVSWIGGSALGFIGTATRQALNLLIALFGLYYLLLKPDEAWETARGFIPFSDATAERLRVRFRDVTVSTVIGTGLAAVLQGILTGAALAVAGIPNALFWGMVTVVLAILPVVGSGLVWGPAAGWLLLTDRPGAALLVALWGMVVVGNVDYMIRPLVFKRWANIHPLTTLVGVFAGVQYFGLLGVLIGPLALSYFFVLIKAYREEFPEAGSAAPGGGGPLEDTAQPV